MKYWISGFASEAQPIFDRFGIVFGSSERIGVKTDLTVYHDCVLTDIADIDDFWGTLTWGPEEEPADRSLKKDVFRAVAVVGEKAGKAMVQLEETVKETAAVLKKFHDGASPVAARPKAAILRSTNPARKPVPKE